MTQKELRQVAREIIAAYLKNTTGPTEQETTRVDRAIQALHAPEREGE